MLKNKLKAYTEFMKLRLATSVVFSAAISYAFASLSPTVQSWYPYLPGFSWLQLILLTIGGFLITGASNGFNQVIEKELDAKMERTKNRPLPTNRMTKLEGIILSTVLGFIGLWILWEFLNPLSSIYSFIALVLYSIVYTPLKQKTSWAVFVGAFPGALPPLLGYVAYTNDFDLYAGILFAIQFMWQFPHFWAIAWKLDDDYKLANFKLLPSGNRDKSSAFQILLYTLFLIPITLLPFAFKMSGWISAIAIIIVTIWFLGKSLKLYKDLSIESATKLMFASFAYLPIVQIAILIDRL